MLVPEFIFVIIYLSNYDELFHKLSKKFTMRSLHFITTIQLTVIYPSLWYKSHNQILYYRCVMWIECRMQKLWKTFFEKDIQVEEYRGDGQEGDEFMMWWKIWEDCELQHEDEWRPMIEMSGGSCVDSSRAVALWVMYILNRKTYTHTVT